MKFASFGRFNRLRLPSLLGGTQIYADFCSQKAACTEHLEGVMLFRASLANCVTYSLSGFFVTIRYQALATFVSDESSDLQRFLAFSPKIADDSGKRIWKVATAGSVPMESFENAKRAKASRRKPIDHSGSRHGLKSRVSMNQNFGFKNSCKLFDCFRSFESR